MRARGARTSFSGAATALSLFLGSLRSYSRRALTPPSAPRRSTKVTPAVRRGVIGSTSDFGSDSSGSSPGDGAPSNSPASVKLATLGPGQPSPSSHSGARVAGRALVWFDRAPAARMATLVSDPREVLMTAATDTAVLVLAAGAGTRMRSDVPKVLHTLAGRSMLAHALHAIAKVAPQHLVVVVGRRPRTRHGRHRRPGRAPRPPHRHRRAGRAARHRARRRMWARRHCPTTSRAPSSSQRPTYR